MAPAFSFSTLSAEPCPPPLSPAPFLLPILPPFLLFLLHFLLSSLRTSLSSFLPSLYLPSSVPLITLLCPFSHPSFLPQTLVPSCSSGASSSDKDGKSRHPDNQQLRGPRPPTAPPGPTFWFLWNFSANAQGPLHRTRRCKSQSRGDKTLGYFPSSSRRSEGLPVNKVRAMCWMSFKDLFLLCVSIIACMSSCAPCVYSPLRRSEEDCESPGTGSHRQL